MQQTSAPDAIPDDLLLAALERAERHDQRRGRPDWAILEQLDIPRRSGKAREVKRRLVALLENGSLEQGALTASRAFSSRRRPSDAYGASART